MPKIQAIEIKPHSDRVGTADGVVVIATA